MTRGKGSYETWGGALIRRGGTLQRRERSTDGAREGTYEPWGSNKACVDSYEVCESPNEAEGLSLGMGL